MEKLEENYFHFHSRIHTHTSTTEMPRFCVCVCVCVQKETNDLGLKGRREKKQNNRFLSLIGEKWNRGCCYLAFHPPSLSPHTCKHTHAHFRGQEDDAKKKKKKSDTDEAMATAALLRNKPSPGSTTLEDVLDSLLGLPPASRTPSPGPGGPVVTATSAVRHRHTSAVVGQTKAGKSCSDLRQDLQGRRTM